MAKQLISLNLAILLLLSMLMPAASAAERTVVASGTGGDNVTWTLYNDGEMVISGSGAMKDFTENTIPWVNYCTRIQSVTVQDGVTRIGHFAFASAINLSLIRIPNSVASIGDEVFWECNALTNITVDSGNPNFSSLSGALFNRDATKLLLCPPGKSGTYCIPDGVEEIGAKAFADCGKLTGVALSKSVNKIDLSAFDGCMLLRSISVAADNTTYSASGDVLFSKDKTTLIYYPPYRSGNSYTVPNGVTTIGSGAFSGNSNLTGITFSDSVTTIEDEAFYNCTSLSTLTFADGLERIGDSAFYNCKSLSQIAFPNTLKQLGSYAFQSCSRLKLMIFHGSAPRTGSYPFSGLSAGAHYPANDATWTCDVRSGFGGSISWSAYDDINDIQVASGSCGSNLSWKLSIAGELSISGTGNMKDYSYYSPAPWVSRGVPIRSVVLEEGLTSIGSRAFVSCKELTSVEFPESLLTIGSEAFSTCANLQLIRIPENVTSIGNVAFAGCEALKRIEFMGNAPSIRSSAFGEVTATACYPEGDVTWTSQVRKNYGGRLTWTPFHVHTYTSAEFFWTEEPIAATATLKCSCGAEKTVSCTVELSSGADGLTATATAVSGKTRLTGQTLVTAVSFGSVEIQWDEQAFAAAYDDSGRMLGLGRIERVDGTVWMILAQSVYEQTDEAKLFVLDSQTFVPADDLILPA